MYTFATPAPISTVVNIPAGRVHVHATDRTDTTVTVTPANTATRRDVRAAERTTVDYTNGVLHIRTHGATNQYLRSTGSVAITIALPTGSHLTATAAAAEFHTTGPLGQLALNGAYHHITIDHATSLHLTAVDGDIEVGHLNGPAQISTARGDIRITQATHGTLDLTTQFGAITIGTAPGVSASLNAATTYGRIDNTLKNNGTTELAIHATTAYGDITAH